VNFISENASSFSYYSRVHSPVFNPFEYFPSKTSPPELICLKNPS
jgi:hypothetical protein